MLAKVQQIEQRGKAGRYAQAPHQETSDGEEGIRVLSGLLVAATRRRRRTT